MQQDHLAALPPGTNKTTIADNTTSTSASFYSLFAGAGDPFAGLDAVATSTANDNSRSMGDAPRTPPALPPKPGRVAAGGGMAAGGQPDVVPARAAAASASAGVFVAARELLPDDDDVASGNGHSSGGFGGFVGAPAPLDVARVAPWAAVQVIRSARYVALLASLSRPSSLATLRSKLTTSFLSPQPQAGQPSIHTARRAGPPGGWESPVSAAASPTSTAPRGFKGSNGGGGRLAVRDFDKARAFEALLAGDGFDSGTGGGGGSNTVSTVRLTSTPAVAAGPPTFDAPAATGATGLVRSRSVVSTASSDASGSGHGGRRVLGGLLKLGSIRSVGSNSGPRSASLASAGLDSGGVFVDTDAPPVPAVPVRARLVAKDASTAGSSGTARELAEFLRATRIESVDATQRAAGAAAAPADGAAVRAASAARPRLVAKDAAGDGGRGGRELAEFLRSTGPDPQPTTITAASGREGSYDGSGGRAFRRGRLASVSAARAAGASAGASAAATMETMPTAMVVPTATVMEATASAVGRREVWMQTDEKQWSESASQASFPLEPLATTTRDAAIQTDELEEEEKPTGDFGGWAGVVVAGGRRAGGGSSGAVGSGGTWQRPRLGSSPEPPVTTTTTGMFVGRLGRRASEATAAVSGPRGAVLRRVRSWAGRGQKEAAASAAAAAVATSALFRAGAAAERRTKSWGSIAAAGRAYAPSATRAARVSEEAVEGDAAVETIRVSLYCLTCGGRATAASGRATPGSNMGVLLADNDEFEEVDDDMEEVVVVEDDGEASTGGGSPRVARAPVVRGSDGRMVRLETSAAAVASSALGLERADSGVVASPDDRDAADGTWSSIIKPSGASAIAAASAVAAAAEREAALERRVAELERQLAASAAEAAAAAEAAETRAATDLMAA
ncbi:hypothetical protein HK405_003180, partial [Cladochytrium tenue]